MTPRPMPTMTDIGVAIDQRLARHPAYGAIVEDRLADLRVHGAAVDDAFRAPVVSSDGLIDSALHRAAHLPLGAMITLFVAQSASNSNPFNAFGLSLVAKLLGSVSRPRISGGLPRQKLARLRIATHIRAAA